MQIVQPPVDRHAAASFDCTLRVGNDDGVVRLYTVDRRNLEPLCATKVRAEGRRAVEAAKAQSDRASFHEAKRVQKPRSGLDQLSQFAH